MVDNFTIPKPQYNPIIANMGYLFGIISVIGFIMMVTMPLSATSSDGGVNMTSIFLPVILVLVGMLGPWIRYLIFARNPENARALPQHEMDEINQRMHGKWQSEYNAQQNGCNMGVVQAQENDVANGNYTYTVRGKNGTRSIVRKLIFYRSSDGRLWFDNYGAQVYELDLPNRFVAMNFMGQDVTWNRMSGGAQLENYNPVPASGPPAYTDPNPPSYNPSAPPSYDTGTNNSTSSAGGKTIAEQIKELNEMKQQGILSQSEFESAKAKILA